MNCPKCQTVMESGDFHLEYTFWGLMVFGASWLKLFFRPEANKTSNAARIPILNPNSKRKGYRCAQCKTSVLEGSGNSWEEG